MPIKIPDDLPGRAILERERVPLILEERAIRQDIRPLQVAILNLMPNKIETETQILRALGATPLQVEVTFLHMGSHASRNTSQEHLAAFYQTPADVHEKRFDALIVTGTPVEGLQFEEVDYWQELQGVLRWAEKNVYSSLFLCWGAMAALYHYHGVPKHIHDAKRMGVFPQRVLKPFSPLVAGFDDMFLGPVARAAFLKPEDVAPHASLDVLVEADDGEPCVMYDEERRRVYILNHLEYEADTIRLEYERDIRDGMNLPLPVNYFPDDNPQAAPKITWRAHRNLLFGNWINIIYQGTPYDLNDL